MLNVEVVFCGKSHQILKKLTIPQGSTIKDVILHSAIHKQFMEIDFTSDQLTVGIFSKIKSLEHIVSEGDRIEVYRPLYQTPMQARIARINKE